MATHKEHGRFLVIIWLAFMPLVKVRLLQRCELAYELVDMSLNITDWNLHIPYWLCIANQTGYNTSYLEYVDGISYPQYYGILQIPYSRCYTPWYICDGLLQDTLFYLGMSLSFMSRDWSNQVDWTYWENKVPACFNGSIDISKFTDGCARPVEINLATDFYTFYEFEENVRIDCSARGFPIPSVTFFGHAIDGQRVNSSQLSYPEDIDYIGYLIFERVLVSDTGIYYCIGSNGQTNGWKEFQVYVVPESAESTEITETTPTPTPIICPDITTVTYSPCECETVGPTATTTCPDVSPVTYPPCECETCETAATALTCPDISTVTSTACDSKTIEHTESTALYTLSSTANPLTSNSPPEQIKTYTACGLARELTYLLDDHYAWNENIGTFCIAGRTTFYNPSHFSGHDENGYATYGIFKINNTWCADDKNPESPCISTCAELMNPDLQASVKCAQIISREKGFQEWPEYEQYCLEPPVDLLPDCMRPSFIVNDNSSNSHRCFVGEENFNIACIMSGYPPPVIQWDERTIRHVNSSQKRIHIVDSRIKDANGEWTVVSIINFATAQFEDERIYNCKGHNAGGVANKALKVTVVSDSDDVAKLSWSLAGSILGILSFVGMPALALAIYMKRKRNKDLCEIYTSFKYGSSNPSSSLYERNYMHLLGVPFPRSSICTPGQLSVYSDVVLGRGAFGTVFQGSFDRVLPVAIKTTTGNGIIRELTNLLMEAKILGNLQTHPNVIKLFGVDISRLKEGYAYFALEFCERGSLKALLDKQRENVFRSDVFSVYHHISMPDYLVKTPDSYVLSTIQLKAFVADVCVGMEFLAANRVVHGDLAARNVLVDNNYNAKITDFGLSHQLSNVNKNYVTADKETCLPWRWLPVESLKFLKFSEASDVWSFGVLMWEIFSYGELPYGASISWNPIFTTYLEQGFQLQKPAYCEEETYALMKSCWEKEASHRPNFYELRQRLQGKPTTYKSPLNQSYLTKFKNT